MLNPIDIEKIFNDYIQNFPQLIHDEIIDVNLALLDELGLLENFEDDQDNLSQFFHVVEDQDKVTLFNEQFIIWILPKLEKEIPTTYVIIVLISNEKPHLEVVFTTSGVYNSPKYVLKVLQHFLLDMIETEATLTAIEKKSQ